MDSEDWIDPIIDAVVSDVKQSGYFSQTIEDTINKGPDGKLTALVWLQNVGVAQRASGLNTSAAMLTFMIRVYANQIARDKPVFVETMPRRLVKAVSNLIRRYHDNFDFGGVCRNVDCLGEFVGGGLSATSGYEEIGGSWYRMMTLAVPVIVNDVWVQTA